MGEDPEFALKIIILPALVFVPKDDVINSFIILIQNNYFMENEEIL